jgi:hypothetical protein
MPKSQETLMETETTIRWDETDGPAVLYTASPAVRRVWASYGFPITPITVGTGDKIRTTGWRSECPVDRISYKPIKIVKKSEAV